MRDYNSKKPPVKKVAAKRPQSKEICEKHTAEEERSKITAADEAGG